MPLLWRLTLFSSLYAHVIVLFMLVVVGGEKFGVHNPAQMFQSYVVRPSVVQPSFGHSADNGITHYKVYVTSQSHFICHIFIVCHTYIICHIYVICHNCAICHKCVIWHSYVICHNGCQLVTIVTKDRQGRKNYYCAKQVVVLSANKWFVVSGEHRKTNRNRYTTRTLVYRLEIGTLTCQDVDRRSESRSASQTRADVSVSSSEGS